MKKEGATIIERNVRGRKTEFGIVWEKGSDSERKDFFERWK